MHANSRNLHHGWPHLHHVALSAIALCAAQGQLPAQPRSPSVLVRSVIDGDTIDVQTVGRVRLLGIDAPEIGRGFDTAAPFGKEAKKRLAALVLHRWVRLESEGPSLDVYNRRLAYVFREDGLFVNAGLVREGLARVTARLSLARLGELKRAESEAQSFRLGIWGATPSLAIASARAGRGGAPARPARDLRRQCAAITGRGTRCQHAARPGSAYCRQHTRAG